MILLFILLLSLACCENNVYLDAKYSNIWEVQGKYFATANNAIEYLMSQDAASKSKNSKAKDLTSKGPSGNFDESRTVRLTRNVLAEDRDGTTTIENGKNYVLPEKYREGITVPQNFEGSLVIDFGGYRYDFSNNIQNFFTIKGGDDVCVHNGQTVIFEDSNSNLLIDPALVDGTKKVTIDEHFIDDRRYLDKEGNVSVPSAVKVEEEGKLVVTGTTTETSLLNGKFTIEKKAELVVEGGAVKGTFTVEDNAKLVIEDGAVEGTFDIKKEGSLTIDGGNVTINALGEETSKDNIEITGGNIFTADSIDEEDKKAIEDVAEEGGNADVKIIHSPVKHFEAKSATCTEEGNIEYWYCEGCGQYSDKEDFTHIISLADTVVSKKDHEFFATLKYDNSVHWYECEVCGFHKDQNPHTISEQSNDSYHWTGCTVCDYQSVSQQSHTLSWKYNQNQHWKSCTGCDYSTAKEDHDWSSDTSGNMYCTKCGYSKEGGGFNPEFVDNKPYGKIETVSHVGNTWVFRFVDTSPKFPAKEIFWYVDDVLEKHETGTFTEFECKTPYPCNYTVTCIFKNDNAVDSDSVVIRGN